MATSFKPFTYASLPATATTIYTTPALTTTSITSLVMANKAGVDRTVTIQIVRHAAQGGSTVIVLNAGTIPVNNSIDAVNNKPIVLGPGDYIQALASAVTSIDVIGSVMEQV